MFSELQILPTNWFNGRKPIKTPSHRPQKRDILPTDVVIIPEGNETSASVELLISDNYDLMILSSAKRFSPRLEAAMDEIESGGGELFDNIEDLFASWKEA